MIGLLGGEVQMMFVTVSSAVNFVKQGKIRMLAVISPERVSALSDVPTMREQGFDMVVGSWQGIYVPKGTPKPIIDKLFDVAQQTMKHGDVVKRLNEGGVAVVLSKSPADFRKFWEAEDQRFGKIIKEANIETE
jgi:tripartite-type tricarboxylate transporter receptor subunit TctC